MCVCVLDLSQLPQQPNSTTAAFVCSRYLRDGPKQFLYYYSTSQS